jgi:hypothetical protein
MSLSIFEYILSPLNLRAVSSSFLTIIIYSNCAITAEYFQFEGIFPLYL